MRHKDGPSLEVLGLLVLSTVVISACGREPAHSIVPMPRSFEAEEGVFVLDAMSVIALTDPSDSEAREVVDLWAGPVRVGTGLALPFTADGALRFGVDGNGGPESYRLTVSESGISILAGDHAGLFYGLQTLSQLFPPGLEDSAGSGGGAGLGAAPLEVGSVRIEDAPRFSYRGMHLDVARHFFGPDFVKRYIDMLARYKINRFHWHLTEDQGWRIQIDRYPLLTEVGAYRAQTHVGHGRDDFNGDGRRYGGFYTKDEIRDIVTYAEARYVTIVPEIEMPGHSLAALAAYPELACTPGPFEVGMTWGVFEDIYCPTDETFEFL
ncbi:MAG: beta-N-acetylhexosaminidase, partial [Longimicrobiales bacterium]